MWSSMLTDWAWTAAAWRTCVCQLLDRRPWGTPWISVHGTQMQQVRCWWSQHSVTFLKLRSETVALHKPQPNVIPGLQLTMLCLCEKF